MGVEVEIWRSRIENLLYKDNMFLETVTNADENVIDGKVVHIPQAGANPNIVKNRNVFPAVAVKRTDTDITYMLDVYTSDPTHIEDAEKLELSYDKIDSVLLSHFGSLRDFIADEMIYNWRAENFIIRTSGPAVPSHLGGTTGNRAKFLKEDLKAARSLFNKQNVPKQNRYALISTDMMEQLMDDEDLLKRDNALEFNLKEGTLPMIYGFTMIERSNVLRYDNSATPVALTPTAPDASDLNDAVLCYQSMSLQKALGEIKFFEKENDPEFYGDVYSALVRMGGRKSRSDQFGVAAIVQDAAP